jgi:hypothetical protein
MSIKFPTELDDFSDPVGSSSMEDSHPELHKNVNDAIEALEAKVGVTDSVDTNSLDYKINHITGSGDVVGPSSATDGNVVLFDTATGKKIKDSGLTLSGTNTGDNATNTQYSGLATSKQDALNGTGFVKAAGTTISYDNSTYLTSVEGTAIKSTGETGGTKFLREDGDGTCSWQTPSYPTRDSLGLDTDDSPQFTAIELGHASDTTIARVSAGVISVEGVTVPTISSTNTLTNKRITPRITTITSNANPTINTDDCDAVTITEQAADIASMTTNLSGTPTNFQKLLIRIKDDGTARGITWGTSFQSGVATLPTTTVATKTLLVGLIYDSVDSKWTCEAAGSRG